MEDLWSTVNQMLTVETVTQIGRSAVLVLAGLILARLLAGTLSRLLSGRLDLQQVTLARRLTFYVVFSLFLTMAMSELGFNLGVLLGAASVLTVAIGFAAQTSTANIISGLFLIAERPFSIGDIIETGGTSGEVLAIDWLSVKLRTFDNLFVRIPNESLIKSEIRTLSRFPIRRCDLRFQVAYDEDLRLVKELLLIVAENNPLVLQEPNPLIIMQGFQESGVSIQFSVWATRENYLKVKNSVFEEVKEIFRREQIGIPVRPVTLYQGAPDRPLTVSLVDQGKASGSAHDAGSSQN